MKEQSNLYGKRSWGLKLPGSLICASLLMILMSNQAQVPGDGVYHSALYPQYGYGNDGFGDLAVGVFHEDLDGTVDCGAVNVFYGREYPYVFSHVHQQFWHQKQADIDDLAEEGDKFASVLASGDFNGDSFPDLAVGVPLEDVLLNDIIMDAGAVNVLYGTADGLDDYDSDFWTQEWSGGETAASEFFGSALTSGDFDSDGYDDLAIGTPGEKVDGQDQAGVVNVLYGSADGFTSFGDRQTWHQNKEGIEDGAQAHDQFGTSLASGDFNMDGYDDLAVGIPFEDIESESATVVDAGAVNIIFGSEDGLTSNNSQFLHQGDPDIEDEAEANDRFGWSLATGKLNGDGYDDLAVGIPQESFEEISQAGAVSVLFGYDYGITTVDQFWQQGEVGIKEGAEDHDRFGWALATGDFNGNGIQDLAIGVPMEDLDGKDDAGVVHVIYSLNTGPHPNDNQLWHQEIGNVLGELNSGDRFGHALAVGDFDGEVYGYAYVDLVIGVPGEEVDGEPRAGWVNVLRGSYSGITDDTQEALSQDEWGAYDDAPQAYDNFGNALAVLQPHLYQIYLPLVDKY